MNDEEIDVFKVLSNPTRRRILMFIAEKGAASYKDLIQIVPKAGALYHHLRLLGDLIEQDEHRMYRLTPKGEKVYEFLISDFFIPEDRTAVQRLLTPRVYLEYVEGGVAYFLLILLLLTSLLWLLHPYAFLLFIVPIPTNILGFYVPPLVLVNYVCCSFLEKGLIRVLFKRRVGAFDLLAKSSPAYIIVNLYPIILSTENPYLISVFHIVVQIIGLLLCISAVSVVARLPLKSALTIVIVLHYSALLILLSVAIGFWSQVVFPTASISLTSISISYSS